MADASRQVSRPARTLEQAVRHTVLPEFARRRPERVLLISTQPERFPHLGGWNLTVLHQGEETARDPVACDSRSLPFQDGSFNAVLLHHVLSDGREAELQESWRVLSAGGDLFVIGSGFLGLGAIGRRAQQGCPRLRVLQVCQQLRRRAFVVEQCAGSGLARIPFYWERRWQRLALPFADTVVIHGRHRPLRPIVRPLSFGRAQALGVRSTAVESCLRRAE